MKIAELARAGRTPTLPLLIELADGERLELHSLLRVLPGQRYVGRATWRGRAVLAKLLVGSKAARHFQREVQGARLLAEQGLNTPQLLAEGQQAIMQQMASDSATTQALLAEVARPKQSSVRIVKQSDGSFVGEKVEG